MVRKSDGMLASSSFATMTSPHAMRCCSVWYRRRKCLDREAEAASLATSTLAQEAAQGEATGEIPELGSRGKPPLLRCERAGEFGRLGA